MQKYDAFVSYSRRDARLVKPLVKLLGFDGRKIFWDEVIEPGERWKERIATALASSTTFIVIWCCHSAESRYVAAEIEAALRLEKPTKPVLICPYPMRAPLGEIQGVDFRKLARHNCIKGHPRGETFEQEDAREFLVASFAPQAADGAAAVEQWLRASFERSRRRAWMSIPTVMAGVTLAVLALLRPFPSDLAAQMATAVNAVAGFSGLLLAVFGTIRATAPSARPDMQSLALAAVIETIIRQAERGESTRLLART